MCTIILPGSIKVMVYCLPSIIIFHFSFVTESANILRMVLDISMMMSIILLLLKSSSYSEFRSLRLALKSPAYIPLKKSFWISSLSKRTTAG